jgi:5'-3' exoribonuclease 2
MSMELHAHEIHNVVVESTKFVELWHKRLEYLNYQSTHLLDSNKLVHGLPLLPSTNKICQGCIFGKQQCERVLNKGISRATKSLQFLHSDICGPLSCPFLSRAKYFLTFIDDYSRKTWAFFLKKRSETSNKFKYFKGIVEEEASAKIKCLRTYQGGQFSTTKFNVFDKHAITK